INDNIITDVIDYIYYTSDEEVTLKFFDLNNSVVIFDIEKDFYEELGLIFETELMDKPKLCRNKCIFCFMDQIPTKSRDTLKLKDDDYRLSFLAGNYVTLTNLDITDIKRIIKFRLSPIN
ncbi:MAG: radical SAM protein, partial [Clostridia bacterium]